MSPYKSRPPEYDSQIDGEFIKLAYEASPLYGQYAARVGTEGTPFTLPCERGMPVAPLFANLPHRLQRTVIAATEGKTNEEIARELSHPGYEVFVSTITNFRSEVRRALGGIGLAVVVRDLIATGSLPKVQKPDTELLASLPGQGLAFYDLFTRGVVGDRAVQVLHGCRTQRLAVIRQLSAAGHLINPQPLSVLGALYKVGAYSVLPPKGPWGFSLAADTLQPFN